MYKVFAKKGNQTVCIYSDSFVSDENRALNPKLTLSESNAGQFDIKLPSTNAGYNFIERMNTEIIVQKNGTEIWSGRVISTKEDFQKNKQFTCEGELAYLNDTTQPQAEFHNITPRNFLNRLISVHNTKDNQYGGKKQFTVGSVTVTDPNDSLYRYTNFESTLKDINDKLIDKLGGYIYVRKQGSTRYLDYLRDEDRPTIAQEIKFGQNLLDFTKSYDSSDFCTVVLPLGARLESENGENPSPIEALDAYTTVESVNGGSLYVVNAEAVNEFGWIEKVINFDDVTEPANLLRKARQYLSEVQFDNMVLEINAVDLGLLGIADDTIGLSTSVRVVSRLHGLDRFFPVTKMTVPLNDPSNITYTMGKVVNGGISSKTITGNTDIMNKIAALPTEGQILDSAKQNADNIIGSFTTGYITIIQRDNGSQELYISDIKINKGYDPANPMKGASKYWRWNLNGLGYYNKDKAGYNNANNLKLAMTMDGSIVADFIHSGTLTLGGSNNSNGILRILNAAGTQIGRWDNSGINLTGVVNATSGSLTSVKVYSLIFVNPNGGTLATWTGQSLNDRLNYILTVATTAQNAANTANSAATTANNAASQAQQTANVANNAANKAQSAADEAASAARKADIATDRIDNFVRAQTITNQDAYNWFCEIWDYLGWPHHDPSN